MWTQCNTLKSKRKSLYLSWELFEIWKRFNRWVSECVMVSWWLHSSIAPPSSIYLPCLLVLLMLSLVDWTLTLLFSALPALLWHLFSLCLVARWSSIEVPNVRTPVFVVPTANEFRLNHHMQHQTAIPHSMERHTPKTHLSHHVRFLWKDGFVLAAAL